MSSIRSVHVLRRDNTETHVHDWFITVFPHDNKNCFSIKVFFAEDLMRFLEVLNPDRIYISVYDFGTEFKVA